MTAVGIVQLVLVIIALVIALSHAASPPRSVGPLWVAVALIATAMLLSYLRL